ncbi:MAG: YihY/virulence factor BrkB family protein [Blautia sp.]|nr:YihY/virulence factor BrkB family protein [Blautia sp.]
MKRKKEKQSVIQLLSGFMDRISSDHVSAYAAQAAYFLILSFIPFVLFLTTFIRYTPLTYNLVRDAIIGFVPNNLQSFLLGILGDVYMRSSAIAPITAIIALWSAGRGMQSITNGLNTIYHVKETRNWLMTRIYSVVYTMLFVISLIVSLTLLVLGTRIQAAIAKHFPIIGDILGRLIGARTLLVFAVLFLVFLFLYKVLPNRKATFKSQIPGALITAVAWSVFSYGFSIYFELVPNFSNMYGNLTAIIMVMLWLYVCMNLVLYGAETNAYFEKQFRMAQASVREMMSRDKETKEKETKEKKAPKTVTEESGNKKT